MLLDSETIHAVPSATSASLYCLLPCSIIKFADTSRLVHNLFRILYTLSLRSMSADRTPSPWQISSTSSSDWRNSRWSQTARKLSATTTILYM